jgi:hypothetical protein
MWARGGLRHRLAVWIRRPSITRLPIRQDRSLRAMNMASTPFDHLGHPVGTGSVGLSVGAPSRGDSGRWDGFAAYPSTRPKQRFHWSSAVPTRPMGLGRRDGLLTGTGRVGDGCGTGWPGSASYRSSASPSLHAASTAARMAAVA